MGIEEMILWGIVAICATISLCFIANCVCKCVKNNQNKKCEANKIKELCNEICLNNASDTEKEKKTNNNS